MNADFLTRLPKAELHRHMEGALGFDTLLELLDLHRLPRPETRQALLQKACVLKPMGSLQEVLDCFQFFGSLLSTPEAIALGTRGAIRQAAREGIAYYELRFSPGFISLNCPLSLEEITSVVVESAASAARDYGLVVPLILIATKELGADSCLRSFQIATQHLDRGVVAVDLAGDEDLYPLAHFKRATDLAREAGLALTVHAGETGNFQTVEDAVLLLGAQRIGHGIAAAKSPSVMALLKERNIPLEISVTSNWLVGACASPQTHPAGILMKHGVPLVFNTDDPTLFDIDLPGELGLVGTLWGLGEADLIKLQLRALDHGFAPEHLKGLARNRLLAFSEEA
jgi:adenosine deaminase